MKRNYILLALIFPALACKKPYNPPVIKSAYSYLVVQGVINSGADSTIINLSRTVNVSSNTTFNPELNATVTLESDKNNTWQLTETQNGNYVTVGLNLDTTRQYRLRIKTANNQQYLSDFVPAKGTPAIDSIGFNVTTAPDTGVQIYANAHDPKNSTRYYRWDYEENWEYHAKYLSNLIKLGNGIAARPPEDYIYYCYQHDVSSTIVLGSTAKLAQDILYQSPIIFIGAQSEKIETKYSILVHQYALTAEAFTFWQSLKKNTEQLGSIFDAEPSATVGNIHNISNPALPALGYLSVSTVQTKRVFIANNQLPRWEPRYPYVCGKDTDSGAGDVPIDIAGGSLQNPTGIYWSNEPCTDCSIRGSLIPPPFWPK